MSDVVQRWDGSRCMPGCTCGRHVQYRWVGLSRYGTYETQVRHNGKHYRAGVYKTIAEAERAVVALRNELFTHNQLDRMS